MNNHHEKPSKKVLKERRKAKNPDVLLDIPPMLHGSIYSEEWQKALNELVIYGRRHR